MKVFETTVEHDEDHDLIYVHLTNSPALAHGRGRKVRTLSRKMGTGEEVRVDLDQNGKIVGIELDGFELPS